MVKEETQPAQHQVMGYDRAITMFSPDGRLLQVEYAKKTVKQGSTAIGIRCKDGVLLVADKRIVDDLRQILSEAQPETSKIDYRAGCTLWYDTKHGTIYGIGASNPAKDKSNVASAKIFLDGASPVSELVNPIKKIPYGLRKAFDQIDVYRHRRIYGP